MTNFTECYLPQIAALSSMLGSGIIIAEVLKDGRQRGAPSTAFKAVGAVSRVLLSMSAGDILFSLGWFMASWARHWSCSCVFQGFIIQLGYMASLLSNGSLAVVYLLMIQYSWHQDRIQTKLPYMMFILWSFCLATALVPLALDMYHGAGPTCWIATQDGAHDATFFLFSLQLIPIWSCIILDSVIMFLIFRKAQLLETQVGHIDPGSEGPGDSESNHGVFSFVDFTPFDPFPMLFPFHISAGGCEPNVYRSMLLSSIVSIVSTLNSSIVSNTSRAYDPRAYQEDHVERYMFPQEEQVSVQLEEQHSTETSITREPQDPSVASNQSANSIHHIAPSTTIYRVSISECSLDSTPYSTDATKVISTTSRAKVSQECEGEDDMDDNPERIEQTEAADTVQLEEPHPGRGIDTEPPREETGESNPSNHDGDPSTSIYRTPAQYSATFNSPRSKKRSQIVAKQGMWYIAGFLMTYGFATISVLVFIAHSGEWNPQLDRTSYFFLASQGVFNFLVFSHGRRKMKTWVGAKFKSWIWNGAAHCRRVCCLLKQRHCLPLLDELHQSSKDDTSETSRSSDEDEGGNCLGSTPSKPVCTHSQGGDHVGQRASQHTSVGGTPADSLCQQNL